MVDDKMYENPIEGGPKTYLGSRISYFVSKIEFLIKPRSQPAITSMHRV